MVIVSEGELFLKAVTCGIAVGAAIALVATSFFRTLKIQAARIDLEGADESCWEYVQSPSVRSSRVFRGAQSRQVPRDAPRVCGRQGTTGHNSRVLSITSGELAYGGDVTPPAGALYNSPVGGTVISPCTNVIYATVVAMVPGFADQQKIVILT